MKRLNQTEKEKLDNRTEIPRLNEDVMGVILQHVFRGQRERVERNMKYQTYNKYEMYLVKKLIKRDENLDLRHFAWPESLKTNSQRLIHHAELKMFPNVKLGLHADYEDENDEDYFYDKYDNDLQLLLKVESADKELDSMLETFKHFDCIVARPFGSIKPAEFIQKQRTLRDCNRACYKALEERVARRMED